MFDKMLEELRVYLDITWEDPTTEKKLSGVHRRAIDTINKYAGVEIDYDADGFAMQLYLDCGRYMWNNAFEDFEANFSSDLVALRGYYEVKTQQGDVANED